MKCLEFLISVALLFAAAACSDDEPCRAPEQHGNGALDVSFRVDGDMEVSRGVTAMAHETVLKRVHILFFDPDDDMFLAYKSLTVTSGSRKLSFDPPENLEPGIGYKVLAVGGADSYMEGIASTMNMFLLEFRGAYVDAVGALQVACSDLITRKNPGELPMFGYFVDSSGNQKPFEIEKEDGKLTVEGEFLFSRVVSRIDIHNLVGGLLDVRYARVANNRSRAYVFTDGLNAGEVCPLSTAISNPAGDGSDGYMPVTSDMGAGLLTQKLEASLYAFPNIVNSTVQNDKVTTCLLIAGYYTDPETGVKDSELTFYRFNLANVGESQVLKRNTCYRAVIKGVRRRGAPDERQAYDDTAPIFEYDVDDEWESTGDNVVSDKDGNFLLVNRTHLTFSGEASDADFVELRLSTNAELDWTARWVDEPGHANEMFSFEKLSPQAIRCGPRQSNHTKYVRYGYLQIEAVNRTTGARLSLPIYLMQLSTEFNVKMLTVNGNTGTFTQELNPMGGSVQLQVATGSIDNPWSCDDDGGTLSSWDSSGVSWTRHGSHGTYIEITVPANTTGSDRSATLVVTLDNDQDGAVLPVTIHLTQKNSSQLMDIPNFPADGRIDIQCCDLDTEGNNNGVIGARNFVVRLTRPELYRYKVTTDFDKNRDLVLSSPNRALVTAAHPAGGVVNKDDEITDLVHGSQFWINPFRTGPNDPMIIGTVTVTAYVPDDPSAPTEERSFTVRLLSRECIVNDVIVSSSSGGYILLPDRNLGTPCRQLEGFDEPVVAEFYSYRTNYRITGMIPPMENSSFSGNVYGHTVQSSTIAGKVNRKVTPPNFTSLLNNFHSEHDASGYWYTDWEWRTPTENDWRDITTRARVSKGRAFIVSEFPAMVDGREIPVICWIHQSRGQRYNANETTMYCDSRCPTAYALGNPSDPAFMSDPTTVGVVSTGINKTMYASYRPVAVPSDEEVEEYKTRVLGY